MYFSHLSLVDFRSYQAADIELVPGVNTLVGPNGQGKTNLVEALGYVATLGSHRVPSDAALVRAGADRAVVRARIVRGDRASTVELEITPGKANRARINRSPAAKARDVLGIARTVLFAPEDLALVKGDPDGRRRFLDQLAVLLVPRVAALHADYDRVLRQRGALLKSAGTLRLRGRATGGRGAPSGRALDDGDPRPVDDAVASSSASGSDADSVDARSSALATLDVWDARLAALGAEITALRLQLVTALAPYVAHAYAQVAAGQGEATMTYRSSVDEALGESGAVGFRGGREEGLEVATSASAGDMAAEGGRRDAGAGRGGSGGRTEERGPDGRPAPASWRPTGPGAPPERNPPSAAQLEQRMLAAMAAVRSKELERGVSLVGPHRDDVVLTLGGLPAKGYASHGESWSFALALRLASYRLLTDGHEVLPWASDWGVDGEPVLVLDDVFAELDVRRRDRLADLVSGAGQVIVTAAVPQDVPAQLAGARFVVEGGTVRRD